MCGWGILISVRFSLSSCNRSVAPSLRGALVGLRHISTIDNVATLKLSWEFVHSNAQWDQFLIVASSKTNFVFPLIRNLLYALPSRIFSQLSMITQVGSLDQAWRSTFGTTFGVLISLLLMLSSFLWTLDWGSLLRSMTFIWIMSGWSWIQFGPEFPPYPMPFCRSSSLSTLMTYLSLLRMLFCFCWLILSVASLGGTTPLFLLEMSTFIIGKHYLTIGFANFVNGHWRSPLILFCSSFRSVFNDIWWVSHG